MKLSPLLQAFAVVLSGLIMAFATRLIRTETRCTSDEQQWAVIAEQVANGVDWPISGPLHFALVRAVTLSSGLEPAQALAFVGTLSVPLLLGLMMFAYAQLGIKNPRKLLILLACSTYFLTPLFESRPQQWGQVLVLMGAVFVWRAMLGMSAWWPYALVLILVAGVHILSFAILAAVSLAVWIVLYALNLTNAQSLAKLALCASPAALIFLKFDGPYATMIHDIRINHLQISFHWPRVAAGIFALASTVALTLAFLHRFARQLTGFLLSTLENHPVPIWTGVSVLAVSGLVLQAAILPNDAWMPYGNSIVLFFLSQTGNLFFLGVTILGLESTRRAHGCGPDQALLQAISILLLSVSLIAAASLIASLWMLHTNWFLRVLNYLCLFMAPFAAIGFDKLRMPKGKWCIWLMMVIVSFTAVVRPAALFNC